MAKLQERKYIHRYTYVQMLYMRPGIYRPPQFHIFITFGHHNLAIIALGLHVFWCASVCFVQFAEPHQKRQFLSKAEQKNVTTTTWKQPAT